MDLQQHKINLSMSEKRVSVIIPYKTSTCVVIMVPTLYDKCNKNKFIKTLYNCMQFNL